MSNSSVGRIRAQIFLGLLVCVALNGCGKKPSDSSGTDAPSTGVPAKANPETVDPKPPVPKPDPSLDPSELALKAKQDDARIRREKEAEKTRLEEIQKKQTEDAIQAAVVLQAPPLGKAPGEATASNVDKLALYMRDLADNEFKFREVKSTVFRSTFNQADAKNYPLTKSYISRNALGSTGKYDFDTGVYSLDLALWLDIDDENKFGDGPAFPRVEDACKLTALIKVDQKTAQRWRESIDKGSFGLTIWYRLTKIERKTWKQNPRWKNPKLAHDMAFSVEILKFESP